MKTVYITIGYSGSGKSTWAKEFAKNNSNTKIVSPDSFRSMFHGEYKYLPELDNIITESCFETAKNLLKAGYDVIIDAGNLTKNEDRRGKWKKMKADKFVAVVMPMDKPVEWYLERRMRKPHWNVDFRKIIEAEMKSYEPPIEDEFDEIIRINNG